MKMQPFGVRLKNLLIDQGITPSQLARQMFPGEERIDARGYSSPAKKDMISKWINGHSTPSAVHLKRLADVLKMPLEELAPDLLARDLKGEPKDIEMSMVAGRPDVARLAINMVVPTDVAMKVLAILTNKDKN